MLSCKPRRSEEHTSELQSLRHLVCRLLLEKKKATIKDIESERLNANHSMSSAVSVIILLKCLCLASILFFFFFNDTATTEIYTLSLHDALPISKLNQSSYAMVIPETQEVLSQILQKLEALTLQNAVLQAKEIGRAHV